MKREELEKVIETNILNIILSISKINEEIGMSTGMIIGSIAKNLFKKEASDIDLLFLYEKQMNEDELMEIYKIKNFEISKYNELFSIKGFANQINICYKKRNKFIKEIETTIKCENYESIGRSWVIGGEILDVLLSDISSAIILFNTDKSIDLLIRNLQNNDDFFNLMYKRCKNELEEKLYLCKKAIDDKNYLLVNIAFGEIVVLLSRIYYARENKYNPGFKHSLKNILFLKKYNLDKFIKNNYDIKMIEEYIRDLNYR